MPTAAYNTSIGTLRITESGGFLTNVYFETDTAPTVQGNVETDTLREAHRQIAAYLAGELTQFDLPLAPAGTDFMKRVWKRLQNIPYGETATYGDLAAEIGKSGAARAVGNANNKNPIPIIIPCHRVIGKDGKLTGYRGGLEIKAALLKLEQDKIKG